MPINQVELIELFMDTVMDPRLEVTLHTNTHQFGGDAESFWQPASGELNETVWTLMELESGNLTLMQALADQWINNNAPEGAKMLERVEWFIDENAELLHDADDRVKRILDFVYTVV